MCTVPGIALQMLTACRFKKAVSEGFDPDKDLVSIGLANQTTMLRNETTAIGKLLERTMMEKYGPANLKQHYMVMDTICDATQVWLCQTRQY